MNYEAILYDLSNDIATITINRPDVRNGLNTVCRLELLAAIKRAEQEARVIVLTGAGKGFCSGQDLSDIDDINTVDLETVLREEYEPLLKAIYDCKLPTIAAVNGAAAGAGANLALACDVVIATASAVFLQAFSRIGLIPDAGGTYWLPRQIGFPRAIGAALFAEPISAQQAADWGMIWEVVTDKDFSGHINKRASHLANGPTASYALLKHAMRHSFDNNVDTQLALEAKLQGIAGKSDDFHEGVNAFLEKRAPKYKGR
jgi:2-(1,2-epoxy-1,2-dihydrophenyl)acetyl-CoA isomerase